jgi:hypothetical protein
VLGFVTVPAIIALAVCAVRRPDSRFRALYVLAFIGGIASLALGIGWARAALALDGLFASRYVTLALPLLCAIYLGVELLRPSRYAEFSQMFLFAVMAAMVQRNRDDGYGQALARNATRAAFRADVDQRMPITALASRHCGALYYVCDGTVFADRIRMLRKLGVPGFVQLPD